jgi:L-asparaginase
MSADRGGVVPALSADQLVTAVPGLAESGITVEVDFRRVPGASPTFEDLAAVAKAIDQKLAAGADGVMITQDTDTIENRLLARPRPHPPAAGRGHGGNA